MNFLLNTVDSTILVLIGESERIQKDGSILDLMFSGVKKGVVVTVLRLILCIYLQAASNLSVLALNLLPVKSKLIF